MGNIASCPSQVAEASPGNGTASTGDKPPPPTEDLEDPAQYWNAVFRHLANNTSIALSIFLDSIEWYGFVFVEPEIAEAIFWNNDAVTWLVAGLAMATLPIGSTVCGAVADLYGRKVAYIGSSAILLLATTAQGLTPITPWLPWLAPAWAIVCRAIQGLGYGGKATVGAVYLAESAPKQCLGMSRFAMMYPPALGYIMLSLTMAPLYAHLPRKQMLAWGWRVPLLFSGVLSIVPLYMFKDDL